MRTITENGQGEETKKGGRGKTVLEKSVDEESR